LLHAEQGLGDIIQFIRYAPLVKQSGGTTLLECPPSLVPLLTTCSGIDCLIPRGSQLPAFDVQAPLMSLPGILGTSLATVPAAVPYLAASPELIERWRGTIEPIADYRIGIAWQGDPNFLWDRYRSIPLRQFAALANVPGVRLVSLQKGPGREQLASVAGELAVIEPAVMAGSPGRATTTMLDEANGAFMDTVAVMKNLDLVVTSDTAIAHLAGALGVRVWVALSAAPDWRWLRDRDDNPWYPTMRLFRQRKLGDWDEVFAQMAGELRQQVCALAPVTAFPREAVSQPEATVPRLPVEAFSAQQGKGKTCRRATICILTYGDYLPYFRRCLDFILQTTPRGEIELRLGFNAAPISSRYARDRLGLTAGKCESVALSEDVTRISQICPDGFTVRCWDARLNLYKEPMARLLFHDVPLITEYVLWFDDDSFVEPGWWEALRPLLDQKIDYFGQPWMVYYLPGQMEMIEAQPWYRGVPFDCRDGRPCVEYATGGFLGIRSERLREASFPDTNFSWRGRRLEQYGGDTLLGEIARQLGWTRAAYDRHIKINVDLDGNHPAPRRGDTGRQFGAEVEVAIE
jgi:hypothetical protein